MKTARGVVTTTRTPTGRPSYVGLAAGRDAVHSEHRQESRDFFFFISPLLLVVLISCIATCKPLPFPSPPNGSLNCFATAIAGWEAQRRRDGLRLLHQAHGLLLAMALLAVALLAAALHADAAPASAAPGSSFPDAYGDRARAAQLPPRKQQPQVAYALRRASATSSAHLHGATSRSFTGSPPKVRTLTAHLTLSMLGFGHLGLDFDSSIRRFGGPSSAARRGWGSRPPRGEWWPQQCGGVRRWPLASTATCGSPEYVDFGLGTFVVCIWLPGWSV